MKKTHNHKSNLWLRKWAKTHLQQSRISNFSEGGPRTPTYREGEGRGGLGIGEGSGWEERGQGGRRGEGMRGYEDLSRKGKSENHVYAPA